MKVPEKYRLRIGKNGSNESFGNNGVFMIKVSKLIFQVIASDGLGWEHVSVIIKNRKRTPTWDEMCFIKDLFFLKTECVVQFHPSADDYVNFNKYCLHLWRCMDGFPTPPKIMV